MQPLEKTLRNRLEHTVKEARDIAESGARSAIQQLGVGEAKPFDYLSEEERILRRRLRAHGRQLGDQRHPNTETQYIDRLIEEVAYEHWHRMLFARFLAENNLLMYVEAASSRFNNGEEKKQQDAGAVSLKRQDAGSVSLKRQDAASTFEDAVPITLEECEDLAADEGAKNGWELAARYATRMLPQIFRVDSPVFSLVLPPEIQQQLEKLIIELDREVFLASDALGWVYQFWQSKRKEEVNASEVKIGARELPSVTQLFTEPYMVSFLLDNSLGAWWAGKRLSEEDFKTAASEEELRQKASIPGAPLAYLRFVKTDDAWAPAAGIFENWPKELSGLKTLDPCCGSGHFLVAAFLMLVPMRMELERLSVKEAVDSVLKDNLHGLEIDKRCVELAAFALALTAWKYPGAGGYRLLPELNVACSGLAINAKKEDWLGFAGSDANLRLALEELYNQFKNAPVLGSLISPMSNLSKGTIFELEWKELGPSLVKMLAFEKDDEKTEMGVAAKGILKSVELLIETYGLIFTNVPYLTRSKQNSSLTAYGDEFHQTSKNELGYMFLEKFLSTVNQNGVVAIVQPQNMLFMARYKAFRKQILKQAKWRIVSRLGTRAFETISGEVVNVGLFVFEKSYKNLHHIINGMDVSGVRSAFEKSEELKTSDLFSVGQETIEKAPDNVFSFESGSVIEKLLEEYADCFQGLRTGDANRFVRNQWEIHYNNPGWELFQTSSSSDEGYFSGYTDAIIWENGKGALQEYAKINRDRLHDMHESGNRSWGKKGVAIGQITIRPTAYYGAKFDNPVAVITPKEKENLPALTSFLTNRSYAETIKEINRGLYVTNAALLKVPFDLKHWRKIAEKEYPNGIPKPHSFDPTQWVFHGHPDKCDEALQVAVARLLGYRWPAELDKEMELSEEAREWVARCDDLLQYADKDGIVCIPAVRGEMKAEERLDALLAAAYGDQWSTGKKSELLAQCGHAGKSMESWLRDQFFTQHCKLFHHRPFIWQIWDGLNDGFSALVNYHKLDRKLLETLIYTYLGDWLNRQKDDQANGIDGASEKLAAAESLKKKLEWILEGEAPYDIFIRWKPIGEQPIGWEPDLNDGVRLNIRPFMSVPDVKKKGAGVLRDKPNIKWGKDRGKDVESSPWYHLFKGDRINDHHLTLAEKRQSRVKTEKK